MLDLWRQPALQALVGGQGASVTPTLTKTQGRHAFLTRLSDLDGSKLSRAIGAELTRIGPLDGYAGMSVKSARGVVIGYRSCLHVLIEADK